MTNWKEITLSDIGRVVTGKTPPTSDVSFYGGLYPFITPTDIKEDHNYCVTERYLSESGKTFQKSILLPKNAVCYTCIASIGKMCLTQKESFTNQQINSVIVDKNKAHYKFIFYLLKYLTPQIKKMAGGTITGIINKGQFEKFPFEIPDSIEEQKEIAGVLSSLDDKIELLREENKTLEATAQTIFKEWFVNFNFPNAEGNPYKSSGGKMIDSELGEIPEGWKVGKLGDVIEIFDSKRIPLASDVRAKRKGKFPYYGATSIMDYIDDYLFDGTYLLLAEDGSVMDSDGCPVLQYVWGQFWVSNHAHVLQGKNGFSTEMLHVLLRKTSIVGTVNGAVQLKINQKNLVSFATVIPPIEILTMFDSILQPIYKKSKSISNQIQTLSTLRDTLLPKLMNGGVMINN